MSRTVLLDTAPLYALLIPNDQAHARARAAFGRLPRGVPVLCPLTSALELHRLVLHRKPADPQFALSTLSRVLGTYPLVVPQDQDVSAAIGTLERLPDQRITLADALLVSLARRLRCRVLTFDERHFELLGAERF